MPCSNLKLSLAVWLALAGSIQQIHADFHLWEIGEVFSNADGSVQYIELFTSVSGQQNLNNHSIVATNSSNTQQNGMLFTGNLSGDTANTTLLLATSSFAQQTGLTPDFIIAAGFLFTDGGSVNFADGTATVNYEASALPKNGIQSINGAGMPETASPTNFAGLSATVSADVLASFDAASLVMNLPVVDVPGVGVANVSFDVNLDTLVFTLRDEFYLYDQGIVAGSTAATLQAGSVLHIPALRIGNELYEFDLEIVGDNPIAFGNPSSISISAAPALEATPEATPEPEPDPDDDIYTYTY